MNAFDVKMAGSTPEIYMYGDIGMDYDDGITADEFTKALKSIKNAPEVVVRLNSNGGDVFEAAVMYGTLKRHPARVRMQVDGVAASAGSYFMMAGDTISIAENGIVMVHEPHSRISGRAADLESRAMMLRKIIGTVVDAYSSKTGQSEDTITRMMADETWMNAEEAKALGFADTITPNSRITLRVDPSRYPKAPARLIVSDGKAAEEYRRRLAAFQSKER